MTDFSPAAAAVRAAYSQGCYLLMPHCKHQLDGMACPGLAAALRAAADQTVPREEWPDQSIGFADWNLATERCEQRKNIRANLLAIAAELESKP